MKFKHKCECNGCRKSANKRLKNNHWVCDEHYKLLMRNHKNKGWTHFYKEVPVGVIGDLKIYTDILVKYA